jgi:hypothetical protein
VFQYWSICGAGAAPGSCTPEDTGGLGRAGAAAANLVRRALPAGGPRRAAPIEARRGQGRRRRDQLRWIAEPRAPGRALPERLADRGVHPRRDRGVQGAELDGGQL